MIRCGSIRLQVQESFDSDLSPWGSARQACGGKQEGMPAGVLFRKAIRLRGSGTTHGRSTAQRSRNNAAGIERGADIGSAGIQRCRPHLLIGEAMGADDAGALECTVQSFNLGKGSQLYVDDGHLDAVFHNGLAQFLKRAYSVDSVEMVA